MLDLRKPKNFNGIHYGYVNYGTKDHPNWQIIKQMCPKKCVEIIRRPNCDVLPDLMNMTSSLSYINILENSKISIKEHLILRVFTE